MAERGKRSGPRCVCGTRNGQMGCAVHGTGVYVEIREVERKIERRATIEQRRRSVARGGYDG